MGLMSGSVRAVASYWGNLFRVDVGGGAYAFLPYLLTAITVGVILAAGYFTVLRALEAAFLRRLIGKGAEAPEDAKTLAELGYQPGTFRTRCLRRMLRDPASIFYRNTTSDELDRVKMQFSAMQAIEEDGDAGTAAPGSAEARKAARAEMRRRKKLGVRLLAGDETHYYIPADRRDYAETHAAKFTADDAMGLVYTTVAAALLWFLLLNVLEPLLKLLVK